MKTNLRWYLARLALLPVCLLATSLQANPPAGTKLKTYSGDVSALSAADKTITVKGFLTSRHFQIADNCAYQQAGKAADGLVSFRPGQRVQVSYDTAGGVLIARQIAQEPKTYHGRIAALDLNARQVRVEHRGNTRQFDLATDCKVLLKDDKTGSLTDLKPGHLVEVTYETPGGPAVIHQIAQRSASYTGTLTAIDGSARTVKVERGLGEKRFVLADNASIVVNGSLKATLSDLRLGEKVTLSFEDRDGVLVVNRVAREQPERQEVGSSEK
ncbi:MAG TPA: DUF5666 domain-containing protein [Candidatus Saccharimonadales bacterium]|nr:DUF5666 domain-containing protein [Candidatus Saccharimonadales bacterium]